MLYPQRPNSCRGLRRAQCGKRRTFARSNDHVFFVALSVFCLFAWIGGGGLCVVAFVLGDTDILDEGQSKSKGNGKGNRNRSFNQ